MNGATADPCVKIIKPPNNPKTIIILLAFFGILIVLSQGSAVAPFIYTIF